MYLRRKRREPASTSLNEPLEGTREEGRLTILDVLTDDFDLDDHCEQKDALRRLTGLVRQLPPREQQVLTMRYGLGGREELTQQQVASRIGVSRSYVSQRRYCKRFCLQRNAPLTAQSLATTGVIPSAPVPGTGSEG